MNESAIEIFPLYTEILATFYGIVVLFYFGTMGNILTIIILIQSGKYTKSTNIFVFDLAVADSVVCFTTIFDTVSYYAHDISDPTCKYSMPFYFVAALTSQQNLAVIALNRYIFILKKRDTYEKFFSDRLSIIICFFFMDF